MLVLPVRRLPGDQGHAVAPLIANQASLPVVAARGARLAALARAYAADAVLAMRQGQAWRSALGPHRSALLSSVFESPLLALRADGWWSR